MDATRQRLHCCSSCVPSTAITCCRKEINYDLLSSEGLYAQQRMLKSHHQLAAHLDVAAVGVRHHIRVVLCPELQL